MNAIFGLLLLAGATLAGNVDFAQCPSRFQTSINRFNLSGCPDGSSTCTVVKGDTYQFEVAAMAHFGAPTMSALYYRIAVTILGIDLILAEGNACQDMGTPFECPVNPGENLLFNAERVISDINPQIENAPISLRLWANTVGSNEQAISCTTFRLNMVNPAGQK